jgi:hypothetical protein
MKRFISRLFRSVFYALVALGISLGIALKASWYFFGKNSNTPDEMCTMVGIGIGLVAALTMFVVEWRKDLA